MKVFEQKLLDRIQKTGSNLCVGIDPRPEIIDEDIQDYLARLLEETAPYAAAFKPNIAYFEAMGSLGYALLENMLHDLGGQVPVILDVKRSDIGETQEAYARAYFENWKVDAVTLNPLLGYDTIEPFLRYPGRGVYLLGVTSNPGATEFLLQPREGRYFFEDVQKMRDKAQDLPGAVGLVAGLTNLSPEILRRLDDLPLLVPGLGAQGGDLRSLQAGERTAPILVNVSRGILYQHPEMSFAERARHYASQIRAAIGA